MAPAPAPSSGAVVRSVCLDNLKVVLIAAIIVGHALAGYAPLGDAWPYSNVREVTLSAPTLAVVLALVVPFVLFLIALLFLVAGLLTPASVARKGPARFARDRLLRLGVPFLVFTLLLWPALEYALYRPLGYHTGSFAAEWLLDFPTSGPLWFVGVLLLLSLGYAGWRALHPAPPNPTRPLGLGTLALVAVAIGLLSFPIRLVSPYASHPITALNEWQWPECVALFAVGVVAAGQGWLTAVPDRLRRQARVAALAGVVVLAVLAALPLHFPRNYLLGGRHWQALAFALVEGALTVFGSLWLLSVAQRHLARPFPHGAALARASYGAFVLQGVFLFGFALLLRPVALPAEVKAVAVGVLAVIGSFTSSWLLTTQLLLVRRVL
jgi:fucose 4-O-acetylase-like acetyltransferase